MACCHFQDKVSISQCGTKRLYASSAFQTLLHYFFIATASYELTNINHFLTIAGMSSAKKRFSFIHLRNVYSLFQDTGSNDISLVKQPLNIQESQLVLLLFPCFWHLFILYYTIQYLKIYLFPKLDCEPFEYGNYSISIFVFLGYCIVPGL